MSKSQYKLLGRSMNLQICSPSQSRNKSLGTYLTSRLAKSLILALFMLLGMARLGADDAVCKKIMDYVFENLPQSGTLYQDEKGFVYLDLDDNYILKLNSFIEDQGFKIPPYFGDEMHGAHITVITAQESEKHDLIGGIIEIGQKYHFLCTGCKEVHPPKWPDIDDVYVITIKAPILTKLRKQYGLKRPQFDFHITIGVKYKEAKAA